MNRDDLIEDLTRAERYRGVLVVSTVIGIVASAGLGIAYALGGVGGRSGGHGASALGFLVLPFAASMMVGGGVYNALLFIEKRRPRRR